MATKFHSYQLPQHHSPATKQHSHWALRDWTKGCSDGTLLCSVTLNVTSSNLQWNFNPIREYVSIFCGNLMRSLTFSRPKWASALSSFAEKVPTLSETAPLAWTEKIASLDEQQSQEIRFGSRLDEKSTAKSSVWKQCSYNNEVFSDSRIRSLWLI